MLLIDGDHLFVYRIGFAIERDPAGMAAAEYNIRSSIGNMVNATQDFDYKIFLTGKDNFRTDVATILPYKGNRKLARKPKYYNLIREYLYDHYDAMIMDGMEADDAMGIEQMKRTVYEDNILTYNSIIVACDKDMDMIPGHHYNPVKHKQYFINEIEAYRNFCIQVLTGDLTDNIPGLKGIGPITARKLLKECETQEELDNKVDDIYFDHCKLLNNHEATFSFELKGGTYLFDDRGKYKEKLAEIKKLLWIRRE